MKFRRGPRVEPDVNLTPLIDVVFLLLIFFMVSTTFERESAIRIELPEASEEQTARAEEAPLEVIIDREGRYYVGGQELINTQPDTLMRALRKAAEAGSERLVISADRNTPHQAVVTAMDVAGKLGFVNVTISTRQAQEP